LTLTGKQLSAKKALPFHIVLGAQESDFVEMKAQAKMGYMPICRQAGNHVYYLSDMPARNISRELQISRHAQERSTAIRHALLWQFEQLGTLLRKHTFSMLAR
jgi:hypothetical protein